MPVFDGDLGVAWDFALGSLPASVKAGYHFEVWLDAIERGVLNDTSTRGYFYNTDMMLHGPTLSLAIDTSRITGR